VHEIGKDGSGTWRWLAEEAHTASNATTLDNSSFVLAAQRTHRKDPLASYNYYTGGWNISDEHYWAVCSISILFLSPEKR
jgi:hypothetical protein